MNELTYALLYFKNHRYYTLTLQNGYCSDFEKLNDDKCNVFNNLLDNLKKYDNQNEFLITFRGTTSDDLKEQYIASEESDLLSKVFYFGDKSKFHYKENTGWLKSIDDCSDNVFNIIFDKINNSLKNSKNELIDEFKKDNKDFSGYFLNSSNKENFSNSLKGNQKARDYYLYFLHTVGAKDGGVTDDSILVSTSTQYNKAKEFAKKKVKVNSENKAYIIYTIIPKSWYWFTVSQLLEEQRQEFKKIGFPHYKGKAVYYKEYEIAMRGGIFPHCILGIRDVTTRKNKFIANPYIFEFDKYDYIGEGIVKAITTDGLKIPQHDFIYRLIKETYHQSGFKKEEDMLKTYS